MTPRQTFIATFILGFAWFTATLCMIGPAYAQVTVDLRPTASAALEWVATAAGTVLTVLAGFAIRFISSKTGLANSEFEASLNARLNDIIHRGIDYAYITALNEVNKDGSGLAAVKVDNWFMSLAASYVNGHAPEILAKFKVNQTALENMIKARLPAYLSNIPVEGALPSPAPVAIVPAA